MAQDFSSSQGRRRNYLLGVLAHHALTDHYLRLGAVSSCLLYAFKKSKRQYIFIMIFLREEGTCLD